MLMQIYRVERAEKPQDYAGIQYLSKYTYTVHLCVCECVFLRGGARERKREGERQTGCVCRHHLWTSSVFTHLWVCVYVWVFVKNKCVKERPHGTSVALVAGHDESWQNICVCSCRDPGDSGGDNNCKLLGPNFTPSNIVKGFATTCKHQESFSRAHVHLLCHIITVKRAELVSPCDVIRTRSSDTKHKCYCLWCFMYISHISMWNKPAFGRWCLLTVKKKCCIFNNYYH